MGADGGVLVVTLKPGATEEELQELLFPWWHDFTYLGSRGGGLGSRSEWIRACRQGVHAADRFVFGGYGTDLPNTFGWDNLADIATDLEDALSDPARGLPDGATFGDYAEECWTRS